MTANASSDSDNRLNVIESNNLETLADMCAMIMASYPLSDVFGHEKIIVMNLGMKNFLNQRITIQNKISALCDYSQVWQLIYSVFFELNPHLQEQLRQFIPENANDESYFSHYDTDLRYNFYDREHIKWNIYSQICRRPRSDLQNFVDKYEQEREEDNEPLKFFAEDGMYSIDSAKNWLDDNKKKSHSDKEQSSSESVQLSLDSAKQSQSDPLGNKNSSKKGQSDKTAKTSDGEDLWSFIELDKSELFERIRDYVKFDNTDERAFELAAKLADTFDQYQIYRPQWILAWNNFSLSDFEAYEKNPDDPKNLINVFINEQCQNYLNRKSGLITANLRKQLQELRESVALDKAKQPLGTDNGEQQDAFGGINLESIAEDSSLSISTQRKAEVALSEAELTQANLRASVDSIRNSFKQNVWQMKLWCMLRPCVSLPVAISSETEQERKDLVWFLSHLDRAQVLYSLIAQLHSLKDVKLPFERVFIFGVSALPQVVIDFLNAISRHCQVFLMLFNPTHVFWADIRSSTKDSFKEYIKHIQTTRQRPQEYLSRLRRKLVNMPSLLNDLKRSDYDQYGERVEGHPLLLSYGKQCKDMINMLLDLDPAISSVSCFSEPLEKGEFTRDTFFSSVREPYDLVRGGNLLKYIQNSIFEMNVEKERYEISLNDRSFEVHSCYTLRREVETLRDNLIRLFNEHHCPYRKANNLCTCRKFKLECKYCSSRNKCQRSDLLPRDIVVMVPAINTYAPHISAVFGGVDKSSPDYIPFVISDQTETDVNTVANALLRLLSINSERITSVMVIELLNEPAIGRRFGISAEDVDVISNWLTDNNVYWGLDEEDTNKEAEIEVPGSFSLGLDRMILGSLLGETKETPCFSEIEGHDALLLGKLWDFIQALRDLRQYFNPELQQTPDDWQKLLQEKLRSRFFDDSDETIRSLRCVEDFINNLSSVFSHLKKAPRLTLPVFAAALRQGLTSVRNFTPFYGERVNFCTLIPMRAVPFKHVFILGLNDSDFPRKVISPAFNLMGSKDLFERGDRSPNLDDRFLFLEALLSARETLYLSYIGQNPIDQTELNPSLVLSELLFYIKDHCQLPMPEDPQERRAMELDLGKAVEDRLVIKERLNAYHIDNYVLNPDDQRLANQSTTSLQAKMQRFAQENSAQSADTTTAQSESKPKRGRKKKDEVTTTTSITASNSSSESLAAQAERLKVPPYELVVDEIPTWRIPSFNRSYINMLNAQHCEKPVLGAGNFSALVGLQETQVVDLDYIMSFCLNPCKTFMQRKLRMNLMVDSKSELSSDESFELSFIDKLSSLSNMLSLSKGEQQGYIDYQSQLGALPYGVFNDMTQESLFESYNKILQTMAKFGIDSAQSIEKLPSATHYDVTLYIPESALYGNNPISPQTILERYNQEASIKAFKALDVETDPTQGTEISTASSSAENSAKSEAISGAGADNQVRISISQEDLNLSSEEALSALDRAKPKFIAPDGEKILQINLTVQLSALTMPLVVDAYSQIKAKFNQAKKKDDPEVVAANNLKNATSSDSAIMLKSAMVAIARYFYEPLPENTEKQGVKMSAGFLPQDNPLYIASCTKERLEPIMVIDRNGGMAMFDAFTSGYELEFVFKQLLIFYLQASCSPYPAGRYVMRSLNLDNEGNLVYQDASNGRGQGGDLSYDGEASYFFGSVHTILAHDVLSARAANFYHFVLQYLAPHYFLKTPEDEDVFNNFKEALKEQS